MVLVIVLFARNDIDWLQYSSGLIDLIVDAVRLNSNLEVNYGALIWI